METLRRMIDDIDVYILRLLAMRCRVVSEIAHRKSQNGTPIRDTPREDEILARVREKARELGLNPDIVSQMFRLIIDDSREQQEAFLAQKGTERRAE